MAVCADGPHVDTDTQGWAKRSDGFLAALMDLWKSFSLQGAVVVEPLETLGLCSYCSTLHKTQQQPLTPEEQGIPLPLNFQALMTSTSPKKILRLAKIVFCTKRSWESEVFSKSY